MEMSSSSPVPADLGIAELKAEIVGLRNDMDKAISLLTLIQENVTPALEGIASSPIGKMLGIGKVK